MRLIDKEMFDLDIERSFKSRLLLKTLIFSGILGLIGLVLLGVFTYKSANNSFKALSTEKLEIIASELVDEVNTINLSSPDSNMKLQQKVNKSEEEYFSKNTGSIFIIDKSGELLVGEISEVAKDNLDFTEKIRGTESGKIEYQVDGKNMFATYEYNPKSGWYIFVADRIDNMTRFSTNVAWTMIITCIIAMALMGTGAVFVTNNITNPIHQMVDALRKTEGGDLTSRVGCADRDDELGILGTSFNNMVTKQAEMIKSVKDAAQVVTSSSEELSATTTQSNQYIESTTASITQLSASVQEIASNAQVVSGSAEGMASTVGVGEEAVEKAIEEISAVRKTVEGTSNVMRNLGEKSQEIGEIIQLITDIAEQTNLLALNAAIEAARAGEHGRGFAVVAEEIQNLAEETAKATDNIADLIRETQNESHEAIKSIEKGAEEVAVGEEIIQQAGEAFEEINEEINETIGQIQDTSAATEQMASGADEVVTSTENIADMSVEIKQTASNLAEEANELTKMVEQFKI
ncbi:MULTISPECIES: methyl-accepting chemotaxis protein [unclassified Candidatus Frackibacter]|uniref:methyl-accepting chemotaxis protein n=1 Tax=unclassified Candidatus Frackibacter TaxID=2648818 RepID=UPI0007988F91|nr:MULTISPECIES: methyl-accepting chemotaxis protein [unclassified Candidatus Frackibacter]KXS40322.1 MAG: hypothetical protein AWU54_2015 [Candidatus Frackibacter sp. T328-2]SDC45292.1 methyl-accepting chemotaxis protein [Candidatus Frackibacter sp. WG11]SEM65155.1 methyl-accepting chemotaxis protein [Candidatus Frackibacter sp. WG12]SFL67265.1 methyl-accepting chemotaxis protein [Candidatus Frackibacter sp. WG13]